ncbi:MAG: PD-(D/E)XK nuclease family protein [Deltaproteobacteria bacterium]|nr:PD-(D/E)XK nuclease family protein [Deltaproteobacteria bacterium]
MTEIKTSMEVFFNNFPFFPKTHHGNIDFEYFEKLIPRIISDKQERSKTTPNVNIFEGFNLGYNELKHCNVLSWFLDPSGNHYQGQLFFEIFLEFFGLESIKTCIDGGYYNVRTEDNFSEQGRVDITISNSQFWFIIEAKILADEQPDQIGRYNDILNKKTQILDIPKSRCKLFFLTIEGVIK